VKPGDLCEVVGRLYVCTEGNVWKRLVTEDELAGYWRTDEFNVWLEERESLLSSFVDDKLDICLSACQSGFVTRDQLNERLMSQEEYLNEVQQLNSWRDEKQAAFDEAVSQLDEVKNAYEAALGEISEAIAERDAQELEVYGGVKQAVDELSAAYASLLSIVNGVISSVQETLEIRYED